ncbi:hypothetical protein BGZ93_010167 [Podila epicladia]|nr:hypothetical protein BGZ92_000054 [Podila epicladia]KAG0100574.1 hypothetical protein BGZ93_010167 [Podila epicladia]
MSTSIFDIPHIVNAVAGYLTPRDQAVILRVNKQWFDLFVPIVWSTLSIIKGSQYLTFLSPDSSDGLDTVEKYQTYVNTLDLAYDSMSILTCNGEWLFPNLRIVRTAWSRVPPTSRLHNYLCYFIQAHPKLHTIDVTIRTIQPATLDLWIEIFGSQEQLRHVKFKSLTPWSPRSIRKVLFACTQLKTLVLVFEWNQRSLNNEDMPSYHGIDEASSAMEQIPETQLRRLKLCLVCPRMEQAFIEPLLKRSPRLQELDLSLSEEGDLPRLPSILENSCPDLRQLALKVGYRGDKAMELLDTVHGLESIELECGNLADPSFASVLAPCRLHLTTLTSLKLTAAGGVPALVLANIANQCHLLRLLMVSVSTPDFLTWTADNLAQLQGTDWQLPVIRTLHIRLFYYRNAWSETPAQENVDAFMDYFMVQIGQQTTIQDLQCYRGSYKMSLRFGLNRLGALKALKVVAVFYPGSFFRSTEAEWIIQHWDSVVLIKHTGMFDPAPDMLLQWRPWLQFERLSN